MHGGAADAQKWLNTASPSDLKDDVIYQAFSDFNGKNYETSIYGRDLEGVQKWKEGTELPLSILKARTTAEVAFQQQFPQLSKFKLTSINVMYLSIVDDWVIQVEFSDPKASTADDKTLSFLVLLNGRVITPADATK
jgi:hypothetical protein